MTRDRFISIKYITCTKECVQCITSWKEMVISSGFSLLCYLSCK